MIVITGMHRSGTSAIANLLMELGVKFPESKDLLPGDQWNERGYFEPKDIASLTDRTVTGYDWRGNFWNWFLDRLVIWIFQPSRQGIERRAAKFNSEMKQLAYKYSTMAIKHPGFCYTLKSWKAVVEIERYVVCLRYPSETVLSMKQFQKFPWRAPLWMGYRLWNFNISSLLEELPVERTLFVNYNCLLSDAYFDELALIRTFFQLPLSDEEMIKKYQKVFDSKLYHNREDSANLLPAKTRKLWERLLDLREQARQRIAASTGGENK